MKVLPPDAYRVTPWRNGKGKTAEIAIVPAAGDRFAWRLSIADVPESGPFSDFSGYERVIAVVEGDGMRLSVQGRAPVDLTRHSDPYAFAGDAPTECTLLGAPIRDFNLIYDPALVRATLKRITFGSVPVSVTPAQIVLLYAAGETLRVQGTSLPAGASARIDKASEPIELSGPAGASALVTSIG